MREFKLLFVVTLLMVLGSEARADECSNYDTPQRVMTALNGDNEIAKLDAQTCGFKSSNKTTRGIILKYLVSGRQNYVFTIEPPDADAKSAESLERMPVLATNSVSFSQDGKTFSGFMVQGGGVHGQILSESLSLNFDAIPLPRAKPNDPETRINCSSFLTINQERGRIEGPLRCVGMKQQYVLVLGS